MHPIKMWVDFTGYPSNHFSGCRLNGRVSLPFGIKLDWQHTRPIWRKNVSYNVEKQTEGSKTENIQPWMLKQNKPGEFPFCHKYQYAWHIVKENNKGTSN